MSKIKMSFSLILAIFLVGILSTAAFAKDPYGLKPVPNSDLSLTVPFTGNTADPVDYDSNAKTYNAVSFDVVLKDSNGTVVGSAYSGTISTTSGKGSVKIPTGVMTPGANYTVELYKTADAAHATLLSKSSAVVLDPHNADMYKANPGPTNSANVDVTGNGLKNANLTGFNNTRKNRTNLDGKSQKIHGFYQNNTNSCASCHQTHTAANGESLLFKDGVYSTCSACHDGTTGAYNSFAPVSSDMTASISGTFNVQTAGHNGSLHEADGSLQISAAPGGNNNPGAKTQYTQEFNCASCHAAHGAGSSSENNLNLDPMGWGSVAYGTATNDAKNGKLFKNITIIDKSVTDPATQAFVTPFILVKTTATADDVGNDPSKYNFWWKRAGVQAGDPVIQTYRWNMTKYVPDYSLWLRELGYPYKANTLLKDASGNSLATDANLHIVYRDAFAYGSSVSNIKTADVSIGIDVETTNNIQSLYDNTPVALQADGKTPTVDAKGFAQYKYGFVPDSGTEMSKYCAACHVDYLSTTRTDNTGVYTTAHRHQTASDTLTCVRCHYGHGSEAQIMHDANDNTYYTLTASGKVFDASVAGNTDKAINYLTDPNPSSALKRYTGMSVCYACHGKGEQFIGNPNTAADVNTNEFLMGGNPGSDRTVITTK